MADILDNINIVNMSGLGQGDIIKMATLPITRRTNSTM